MNYPDGQEAKLGDLVRLGGDERGVVVCSIDTGEFSDAHPKAQWGHLKQGVMVEFEKLGLVHYVEPDADMELISRGD